MLVTLSGCYLCRCTGMPGQRPAPQFMAAPDAIPGVPPGLEYLAQIDQLLVHQQVEIFERELAIAQPLCLIDVIIN